MVQARKLGSRFRFAWMEYQHHGDAVVFTRQMTARLGMRNLFLELPRDPAKAGKRTTKTPAGLDVSALKFGSSQAFVARPKDDHVGFIGEWITNPGVEAGELTAADVDEQADILCVSGHGGGGMIWGDALEKPVSHSIDVASQLDLHADKAVSGRLKILMLPSCTNLALENAPLWLPAFARNNGVHLMLGYEESYSGGSTGAAVMAHFARALEQAPDKPFVAAWRKANRAVGRKQPWAALAREDLKNSTLAEWAEGLPSFPGTEALVHFNEDNSGGKDVDFGAQLFSAKFVMENGTVIDRSNRADTAVGLFPPQKGKLRIEAAPGATPFAAGDEIVLVFYRYRRARNDMDLDKLLAFEPADLASGFVNKLTDANFEKVGGFNNKVDGIQIIVQTAGTKVEVPYSILPAAHSAYPQDGPDNSFGLFVIGLFPPGVNHFLPEGRIFQYADGAFLR